MIKIFFLLTIAFSSIIMASQKKDELGYREEDVVKGWMMYREDKKDENTTVSSNKTIFSKPKKKATIDDLYNALLVMIKELKETKKEIKKIKKYINPNAPHYIIKNGKKCLANSDKDCFEMPIIQEGRNIPALKNFMKDPSVKNATKWLGVQAKIFNRSNAMGVALKFAALEGGPDAYPVSASNFMYSQRANNAAKERSAIKKKLKKYKDNIGTIIFLGKTPELDNTWGKESLARLAYPDNTVFNMLLVFYSKKEKDAWDSYYENLKDKELSDVYSEAKKIVNPKLFKLYKVDVSPTVVAIFKDKEHNKSFKNTIAKGFPTKNDILDGYEQFLIFNKVLKEKDFHGENIWQK